MDIEKVLAAMTLEEKCALLQGADFWHTVAVERLGVPQLMVSDGPHGLRKQDQEGDHLGINDSIKAVCFPTAVGTAASFDPELLEQMGEVLGEECLAEGVDVLLGPAANIKRSPLCGRNFEYFSEDPLLSGRIAAALIRGVQKKHVGTSLKHFAMNSQETRRMSASMNVPERAMREIYLASFEHAVKGGHPWTVMCAYNKVNGTYCSENPLLLTDILRKEWGFDGVVMTDWGAANDRVKGVPAGLELEMPRSGDENDQLLAAAVRAGALDEAALDEAVRRMLRLIDKCVAGRQKAEFDRGADHHQARKFARDAMVLLKNDGGLLPIRGQKKVAFIGEFAEKPRFQGGGSSHINCSEVLSAAEAVRGVCQVTYATGYGIDTDDVDAALEAEAVAAAKAADVAVVFIGLPERRESEGYDRADMKLPENQNHLAAAVAAAQPNTVVVLMNGSPVEMPWAGAVPAILESYLGGQAAGGAAVDLLFGAVSPSAKLAETFPLRLEDTPCYLNFPGEGDEVNYAEGIWVGYRYYDKKQLPVLFPFGHGLSYTTFAYGPVRLSAAESADGRVTAEVDVTNTGSMAGAEVVQLYVAPRFQGRRSRPVRELRDFCKLHLQPGETKTAVFELDARAFSYWETDIHDWVAEPGEYAIEAAASSRDIRSCAVLKLCTAGYRPPLTMDSTFGDAMAIPGAAELLKAMRREQVDLEGSDAAREAVSEEMMLAMMRDMPIHCMPSFGQVTKAQLRVLLEQLNALS